MHRLGVVTFGKCGINYDKTATDPEIKSYWVAPSADEEDSSQRGRPSGDLRRICGPIAGHVPALCDPTIEAAMIPGPGGPDGAYVDCTFGRGGHSVALLARLSSKGRLFAFDVDPSAVAIGRLLEAKDPRFNIFHRPFGDLAKAVPENIELSGVLMDLGVSSPQLDDSSRGFTSGKVDMRMNPKCGKPVSEHLQELTSQELSWIVREYGDDGDPLLCARIAEGILMWQAEHGPFQSLDQLANPINRLKRGLDDRKQKPEKLTFQALRMWVNEEFAQFEQVLEAVFQRLRYGGRCAVICFKRAETLLFQRFVSAHEEPDPELVEGLSRRRLFEMYPLLRSNKRWCARQVCNPIAPTEKEILYNNRCRSARTHVLEKRRRRVRWNPPADYHTPMLFKKPVRVPTFGGMEAVPEPPEPPPEMGAEALFCRYVGTELAARVGAAGVAGGCAESTTLTAAASSPHSVQGASSSKAVSIANDAVGGGDEGCGESVASSAGTSFNLDHISKRIGYAAFDRGQLIFETTAESEHLSQWLLSLDDGSGKLLRYLAPLEARCGSLQQLSEMYFGAAGFDTERFCNDMGFEKVAHRRFVARWAAAAQRRSSTALDGGPAQSARPAVAGAEEA